MIAEVIVDISNSNVDKVFDYLATEDTCVGCRVSVPFGARRIEGYVLGLKQTSELPAERLKSILEVLDDYPVLRAELLDLMRNLTAKYHWRIVDVLRLFLPAQMRGGRVKPLKVGYAALIKPFDEITALLSTRAAAQAELVEYLHAEGSVRTSDLNKRFSAAALTALQKKGFVAVSKERLMRRPYKNAQLGDTSHQLTTDQQKAFDAVIGSSDGTFLLHGVTGSGKTEVYLRIIQDCLSKNKSAMMLVPEISLTPQMLGLFRARFGDRVALLHSGLSAGERLDEWTRLREGDATIAVGARSAIFAPLSDLGVIIIDEEHDDSYSSETTPQYDTREIAAMRATYNGCPLVLGSATPSIDSYWRAKRGEYRLLEMPNRINRKALPEVHIVDMCQEIRKGNPSFLSGEMQHRLTQCIDSGHQAIIFLNRRGFASYQQCRSCGYVVKCEDCDVPMVFHREEDRLKCHYCSARKEPLSVCPECGSVSIKQGSMGTERVVSELMRLYPKARILRMDRDTTDTKDAHEKILSAFRAHEADILVGTQMVAKGHDFGECTLVGILEADLSLYTSDFRAVERTFQLITQVSGRAGRAEHEGHVVLQTYSPRHYVFRYARVGDYCGFFDKEINVRETTKFPPFSVIIRVVISSEDETLAIDRLHLLNDAVLAMREKDPSAFYYAKSMRAPMRRIRAQHRVQMVIRLKAESADKYIPLICAAAEAVRDNNLILTTEINPKNMR